MKQQEILVGSFPQKVKQFIWNTSCKGTGDQPYQSPLIMKKHIYAHTLHITQYHNKMEIFY